MMFKRCAAAADAAVAPLEQINRETRHLWGGRVSMAGGAGSTTHPGAPRGI